MAARKETKVLLEVGQKRVFATAVDWPGWCRSGKGEDAALAALAEAHQRYAPVAAEAGVPFPPGLADHLVVVETVKGNGTTDFGAPGIVADLDRVKLTKARAERRAGLLAAAWTVFDRVVDGAPEALRKGPRGGGRDRDPMVRHVQDAEWAYVRKLGLRLPEPKTREAYQAQREAILAALRQPSEAVPAGAKGWPPHYAVARMAWHVLDHAWEMADRSDPNP
jgi:hypothetical protein